MKRFLCMFLVVVISILCCACSETKNTSADSEQLTYYYTEQYMDQMVEIIKRYNRWCSSHSTEDMKIKLIEFEDYETMSERLNIEVMSGGGPDLFSNYMNLPFEKLIQNGAFRDLNELIENDTAEDKIDLDNYNQAIMDAGVYDGKRYYLPAFYRVDTIVGYEQVFEKYHMPTQQGYHLSFENMEDVFSDYLQNPGEYFFMCDELWSGGANANSVILKLIYSRVDFEKKTTAFDEDFKDKLSFLMKLKEHSSASLLEDTGDPDFYEVKPFLFSYFDTHSNPVYHKLHEDYQSFNLSVVLRHNWLYILLRFLIVVLLIAIPAVLIIIFPPKLIIPPNYIPFDNIFDLKHYIEVFTSQLQQFNANLPCGNNFYLHLFSISIILLSAFFVVITMLSIETIKSIKCG